MRGIYDHLRKSEVSSELAQREVELVPFSSSAEVYIINTCEALKR